LDHVKSLYIDTVQKSDGSIQSRLTDRNNRLSNWLHFVSAIMAVYFRQHTAQTNIHYVMWHRRTWTYNDYSDSVVIYIKIITVQYVDVFSV